MRRLAPFLAAALFLAVFAPLGLVVVIGGGLAGANSPTCASPVGNQAVAMTGLVVGTRMAASEKVLLAAIEAGLVESGMRNLANDGRRGPEDNAASDADLAVAAQSLALPHDGVGSDNDSVGVLQQRNSWGTPAQRLDPTYAFGEFYKRAIALEQAGFGGTAAELAQTVQVSAFPGRYEVARPDAEVLIASLGQSMPVGCQPGSASPAPGGYGTPGPCGLSPSTDYARYLIGRTFGVTDIGGCATSGHVAGSYHYPDANGQAHALDVMVYGNRAQGDRVAAWAVANAKNLNAIEVIWYREIWTPSKGWHPYGHPSGSDNPTLAHEDHVHISLRRGT